jgi:hypothetical protein
MTPILSAPFPQIKNSAQSRLRRFWPRDGGNGLAQRQVFPTQSRKNPTRAERRKKGTNDNRHSLKENKHVISEQSF